MKETGPLIGIGVSIIVAFWIKIVIYKLERLCVNYVPKQWSPYSSSSRRWCKRSQRHDLHFPARGPRTKPSHPSQLEQAQTFFVVVVWISLTTCAPFGIRSTQCSVIMGSAPGFFSAALPACSLSLAFCSKSCLCLSLSEIAGAGFIEISGIN